MGLDDCFALAFGGGVTVVLLDIWSAAFSWFDRLAIVFFPCGGLSGPSAPSPSVSVVSSEESGIAMVMV